jgi:hypothetical protein
LVRVGGIASGGIILDSVVLVCCRSLHFCHYVGFGSGIPGMYAIVASASIMETASSRSVDTYSQHIRRRLKGVWQSYLAEDNTSLIPERVHICLSATSAWCGVEVHDICWRITLLRFKSEQVCVMLCRLIRPSDGSCGFSYIGFGCLVVVA